MFKKTSLVSAVIIGFGLIVSAAADLRAEAKLSYDGQIRLRSEYDLKSVHRSRHSKTFHDLRTRVGLKFEPTDKAMVYIQLQDSRRLGNPSSGSLEATNNVDLHQAYFEIKDAVFNDLVVKAGRFELVYGNQRVFGSVGWNNVGRSWEGAVASYRPKDFRADFFYLKRIELNDEDYNRDFDIYGLYGTIWPIHLDLFWFYELDADSNGYVQEKLKRHNLGCYFESSHRDFDLIVQGNYQFGEKPYGPGSEVIQDISAYMFNTEIGYTFYGRLPGRVAAGIDYTSGDEHRDPNNYTGYTGVYYTAHKFMGYMDYFPQGTYGLFDKFLNLRLKPSKRWSAGVDLHHFTAPKMVHVSPNNVNSEDMGTEIDLTVEHKSVKEVNITGGFSVFFPRPAFSNFNSDLENGYWAYLMTTVNF